MSNLASLLLWNLREVIWQRLEAYGEKGNILRFELEIRFLRNYFVIGEFISKSYTFLFVVQFGSTVFVETAKGYLGAHRDLR